MSSIPISTNMLKITRIPVSIRGGLTRLSYTMIFSLSKNLKPTRKKLKRAKRFGIYVCSFRVRQIYQLLRFDSGFKKNCQMSAKKNSCTLLQKNRIWDLIQGGNLLLARTKSQRVRNSLDFSLRVLPSRSVQDPIKTLTVVVK